MPFLLSGEACRDNGLPNLFVVGFPQGPEETRMGVAAQRHQVVDRDAARLRAIGQNYANEGRQFCRAAFAKRFVADIHFAAQGREKPAEGLEQRRLARAVAAQQAGELTRIQGQVEMRVHGAPPAPDAVSDGQAEGLYGGFPCHGLN